MWSDAGESWGVHTATSTPTTTTSGVTAKAGPLDTGRMTGPGPGAYADPAARPGHVVVGIDGSPASLAAARWTRRLAADLGWSVDVVAAWPEPSAVFIRQVPGHFCESHDRAARAGAKALEVVRNGLPEELRCRMLVVNSHPVDALVDAAVGADLLVLGRPRSPRGADQVVSQCETRVSCPVMVVPAG